MACRRMCTLAVLPMCIAAFSPWLATPAVLAADYYLSPDGDDANDGSFEHPWKTWLPLPGGSTLYMRGGRYVLNPPFETVMQYQKSGTADEPTTICNYPGEQPIIEPGLEVRGWHMVFRGLTFVNSRWCGLYINRSPSDWNRPPAHHVTVDGCVFEGHQYQCLKMSSFSYSIEVKNCTFRFESHGTSYSDGIAINLRSSDVMIHDNVFYRPYMGVVCKMQAKNVEIYRNVFVGEPADVWIDCAAIIMGGSMDAASDQYPAANCVAHDNLIYNWPGAGIIFWEADACQAYNNTVVEAGNWPAFALTDNGYSEQHCRNVTIQNNIIAKVAPGSDPHYRGLLAVYGENTEGFLSDHNLWYDYRGAGNRLVYGERWGTFLDLASFNAATGNEANGIYGDPLFVSQPDAPVPDPVYPFIPNLRLQTAPDVSPAIDAGETLRFGWPDLAGNSRLGLEPWDMGCYEYGAAPPPTDGNPTITLAGDHPNDQGGAIDIYWSDYTPPDDFGEYRVYRSTEPFNNVTGITPINPERLTDPDVKQYTDTTTTDGTDYYYAVTCVDAAGDENKSVQCVGPLRSVDNIAPAPPTDVNATPRPTDQGGGITVTWTKSADDGDGANDVVGYDVLRSTTSGSGFAVIGSVDAGVESYVDGTTTDGQDYYYKVRAKDSVNSADSDEVGPVRWAGDTAPAPITALNAQDTPNDDGGAIDLDWSGYTAPANFDHYNIYRSESDITDVAGLTPIGTVTEADTTSYTDRTTTDGTDYYYAVTCEDTSGNENKSVQCVGPVRSEDNLAPLESHNFPPGIQLVTMPARPANVSLLTSDIFLNNPVVRWGAATQAYVYWSDDSANDRLFAVRPGAGFWVKFPGDEDTGDTHTTVSYNGRGVSTSAPFEMSISPQWNVVGNPWQTAMPWSCVSGAPQGSVCSFGWVYDPGNGYELVASIRALNAIGSVPPYHAFWIHASADIDKVIISAPVVGQSSARSVGAPGIRWLVPIVVRAAGKRDACNGIGAADTDMLIDNPPAAPNAVDAFLTSAANPSSRMAYELRSVTGSQTFNLTVATEVPDADVTVAMPDLSQLPKGYRVTLRDLDAGKVTHVRTARAYTYNSGPGGGQRRFEVQVGPASVGALTITGVSVVPLRGSGAEIRYNVSDAGTVTTRIYNVAGRLVGELERGRSVSRGPVASVWDGRSVTGTLAPSGTYVLEIVAVGEGGQRARAVHPLVVRR